MRQKSPPKKVRQNSSASKFSASKIIKNINASKFCASEITPSVSASYATLRQNSMSQNSCVIVPCVKRSVRHRPFSHISKVASTAQTCLSRASTRQEIFQYTKADLYGLASFRIMYKQIFSSARVLFLKIGQLVSLIVLLVVDVGTDAITDKPYILKKT